MNIIGALCSLVMSGCILSTTQATQPSNQNVEIIEVTGRNNISYVTMAEFELVSQFVEIVAGDESFETQYEVSEVVFNRLESDDYPNYIDEIIWKKDKTGLWSYIPDDVSISEVTPSDSVYEAVTEALFNPSDYEIIDIDEIL